MILRKCPDCGTPWYSSNEEEDWECQKCGKMLTPEMNEVPAPEPKGNWA
jgi:ribosomal protein L37AE/L43A